MANVVFILYDKNKKVWGIYNSTVFLKSMVSTLKEVDPTISLFIDEYTINTNLSGKNKNCESILENNTDDEDGEHEKVRVNKELRNEIKKLEIRYDTYKGIKDTLSKLDKNAVVPDFLKKQYSIFSEIETKNIPDEEKFGYYLDNLFYTEKTD
jgi:hypothetical protein